MHTNLGKKSCKPKASCAAWQEAAQSVPQAADYLLDSKMATVIGHEL